MVRKAIAKADFAAEEEYNGIAKIAHSDGDSGPVNTTDVDQIYWERDATTSTESYHSGEEAASCLILLQAPDCERSAAAEASPGGPVEERHPYYS